MYFFVFYQPTYVYLYTICVHSFQSNYTTNLYHWLHLNVRLCEQKCLLEFMHLRLWFLIWFMCIINWQSVFSYARALPICICPCVLVYRKCLLFILGIASCACVCTESAIHMFWWLHFVNWFMFIHLLFRHSNFYFLCVSWKNLSIIYVLWLHCSS